MQRFDPAGATYLRMSRGAHNGTRDSSDQELLIRNLNMALKHSVLYNINQEHIFIKYKLIKIIKYLQNQGSEFMSWVYGFCNISVPPEM